MLFWWFIFFTICLCVGIVSFIIYYLLMEIYDRQFDVLTRIGILGILIGIAGFFVIALKVQQERSLNNKVVDGIVENPSGYTIYFDDGTYTTLYRDANVTIVKDTDTVKVNTINMLTYSFEIPGDCIIWQWQPYSKIGGARD